ncbi:MAG: lysophospholipid acyltransferase family protein [Gemmatimonadaceae bacterium]|nr:lysophospholipid acyltransferase family protein [Gemmatimonadaceae bacterium]
MAPERDTLSYRLLAGIARLAVRWYYRAIEFDGVDRIPRSGPTLLVVNHPNELMDALFAGLIAPRQLTFTGKATLFGNALVAAFLRHMRVVPLRRVQDERSDGASDAASTVQRNAESFAAIHAALAAGQMVLIFPEGRSWDEPRLAPIKTGAARIALSARDAGVPGVTIVPVGINYERKDGLRSRVLVEVGDPIVLDSLAPDDAQVDALTTEIARRLYAVTLNFDDDGDADEVLDLATVLAATTDEIRPLGDPDAPISAKVEVARRADRIRQQLARGELSAAMEERVRHVQRRLLALRRVATRLRIRLDDVALDTRLPAAGRFVLRELLLAVVAIPLAVWGRVNHFLPFSLARWLGVKTSTARSQLAMHTIVLGVVLIPLFYAIQTLVVGTLAGSGWALLYGASLIPSASWDIRYRERLRQIRRRAMAWRHFRDDPGLQSKLRTELVSLRSEATAIASEASRM